MVWFASADHVKIRTKKFNIFGVKKTKFQQLVICGYDYK